MSHRGFRPNLGTAFISTLIFWAFSAGLLVSGLWSLEQTIRFSTLASTEYVGPWVGIAIQFGQNFALFMRNRERDENTRIIWAGAFLMCAMLDAATNIGEFRRERTLPEVGPIAYWFGHVLCVVVVLVEEVLAYSLAAALHYTNDLLQAMGGRRIPALDWAAEGAKTLQPRPVKLTPVILGAEEEDIFNEED